MTVAGERLSAAVRAREFVAEPTDPVDERIEVGVLIVGAGPAGLACAIRLGQLLEEHPEVAERLGDVPVAVVEKGKQAGSHLLSGAVVNPRALRRLFTRPLPPRGHAVATGRCDGEAVYVLTQRSALRIPPPPTMRNHGNWIFSLSQLGRWLAERAEEGGAMVLPETAAREAARLARPGRRRPHRRQGRGTATASRWATSSPAPTSSRR